MTAAAQPLAEVVGPFLPLLGVVAGGLVVGFFAIWNRKRGAVETKLPTIEQLWRQQVATDEKLDIETNLRRELENKVAEQGHQIVIANRRGDALAAALEGMRDSFKHYVARMHRGEDAALTRDEKTALELTVQIDDAGWPTRPAHS